MGLSLINVLIQKPMKKSILNIKLTERPPARDCKTQNGTNSGVLDNRTKDFSVVKTRLLVETLATRRAL
ncbi:unnamed protein product [Prunus armeniaca]|uniref:Uncharacterized protein n=1 Tax=Prunus armeniaca TaxID=36596 RepID=A0A6J5WDB4_PRUAR|nr:unnamed protein product [Prunus armeniaca]